MTTNRFLIPGFEDETNKEVRIVGDSIVRGQLNEFCGRNPSQRRNYCMPGGRIEHINDSMEVFTEGGTKDTGYIIHVGTNNIINNRSEELLCKYRKLISNLKKKTNNIIISGVLPRFGEESSFLGRAIYINNIMKVICREENVHFINLWEHFYNPDLFRDGIHLNKVGEARLGRLLNNAASNYFQMERTTQTID